ncbi:MAG: choice-of-anchor D domain-containing protein, partial [Methylophilaceae bacterium]|nr:choice-of-anchor D domain-containing protein [Methylophilaceae bacterium]
FSTAGVQSGTVSVGFETDGTGTSGLGTLSIGTQTVNLIGTVYRLAAGSLGASTLTLAAVREGQAFGTGTLSVYNVASTDGFSEKLDVSLGVSSGSATVINGTLGLLAAGSSNSSTLQVSLLNTATAGIQSGTVSVNYLSNGLGTSGLSAIDAGSATLTLSGTVYRYAAGSLSTTALSLGTIRAGQAVSGGSLTVTNSGGESVYTDLLGVSTASSGGFAVSAGSLMTLSGGSSSAMSVIYGGTTASAGLLSGTLTLSLNSVGQTGLTTYAPFALAGTSVAVNATVYRPAVGALVSGGTVLANGGTVNLGNTRVNTVFGTPASLYVRNTAVSTDVYSEKLNAVVNGALANGTGSGSVTQLAAGGTSASAFTMDFGTLTFSTAGVQSGTVSVGFETDGTGTSGLGTLSIGTHSWRDRR